MKKLTLILLATVSVLLGCDSENPPLTGVELPPAATPAAGKIEVLADGSVRIPYDMRVDILLVIDDSRSMKNHQENMARNFKSFVNELTKISAIDFHIAYTFSHDRTRYGSIVPQMTCDLNGNPLVGWEPVGSLRPLIGPADKLPTDGRRYVTRDDDFTTILSQTLDPAVNTALSKDFLPNAEHPKACGYGPENEEMFSPVLGLLQDTTLQVNMGFRREGAFFVTILFSDAKSEDVQHGLTPDYVEEQIAAATGGGMTAESKRYRVLSVAMKPGVKMTQEGGGCYPDPIYWRELADGRRSSDNLPRTVQPDENPLAILAQLTQDEQNPLDQVLSICDSNYGETLLKFGNQVQKDTITDVKITLPGVPQVFLKDDKSTPENELKKNLSVNLGETPLERGKQWVYNSQKGVITVFGQNVDWEKHKGQKISVQFVPVDLESVKAKAI